MKLKRWQTAVLILLSVGFMSYAAWNAYGNSGTLTNADFIRFHVIANSNTQEDQRLKLQVRDGLLAEINLDLAREAMKNHKGDDEIATLKLEESRDYVKKNLEKIEKKAQKIVAEKGYGYDVKAELGVRWIP
ncbi:MAG: stage II sporulation protein R, partial [Anaerovorax sp.]